MDGSGKKDRNDTNLRLFIRRLPVIFEPIRRLINSPGQLIERWIKKGDVIVDLACAWGFYTFPLAEWVGTQGRVIAVDLDEECVRYIRKKAVRKGFANIAVNAASAADLNFIKNHSVDFVLASGLFCSMLENRPQAVNEIKRILKPSGKAYISLGMKPPFGLVDEEEWKRILKDFKILQGSSYDGLYALVSPT